MWKLRHSVLCFLSKFLLRSPPTPKAVSKQKWDGSCVLHLESTKTTINTKLGKNKGTGKLPLRKIKTKSKF